MLSWLAIALKLLFSILEAVIYYEGWFVHIQMRSCFGWIAAVILNQILLVVKNLLALTLE